MSKLVEQIKDSDGFASLGRVSEDEIKNAEQVLGLFFAEDYKELLLAYGAIFVSGHEIIGISDSNRLNVIAVTSQYRNLYSNLPHDLYVVEDLSIDNVIVVQKRDGVLFTYGPDEKLVKVATSIQEYLFPNTMDAPAKKPAKRQKGFLIPLFKKIFGK